MTEQTTDSRPETPPYVAYATFKNTVRSLHHGGSMVNRVDVSALSTMSGSAQKLFLGAVRVLGLVDEQNAPTDEMRSLAAADTDEKWKPLIRLLVERFYAGSLSSLATGTPQQLKESFGNIPASTVTPAARFLIHAAKDAGITISHVIEKNKASGGGGGGRSRRRTRTPPPPPATSAAASDSTGVHAALLAKFPAFDPEWDEKRQQAWFSAYEKLLEMNQ